jgi:hypothetical protein
LPLIAKLSNEGDDNKAIRNAMKLRVGDKAPGFSLVNTQGVKIDMPSELEQSRLIVAFYRGFW